MLITSFMAYGVIVTKNDNCNKKLMGEYPCKPMAEDDNLCSSQTIEIIIGATLKS